jgi:hypothetical protein
LRHTPAPIIGAVAKGAVVDHDPNEWRIRGHWQERSTDLVERYEMRLRGAQGMVVRQRSDSGDYSAYLGYEGRQQWAEQLFGNVEDAQAWCEVELVQRTTN